MLAGKGPGRQEFIIHRSGQEVAGGRGGSSNPGRREETGSWETN